MLTSDLSIAEHLWLFCPTLDVLTVQYLVSRYLALTKQNLLEMYDRRDPPLSSCFSQISKYQRETDFKNLKHWERSCKLDFSTESCVFTAKQQRTATSAVASSDGRIKARSLNSFIGKSSVILSAASIAANAARCCFITLADMLNLDTVTTRSHPSEVTKIQNKRILCSFHTIHPLYNS